MRRSPLRHPLAVLRTTIGLTQKEMGALVGRAPRTIQAIELGHLKLSEELALELAKETGIDESWLLREDANLPPTRCPDLTSLSGGVNGPYTREDYETMRAYKEAPTATQEELDNYMNHWNGTDEFKLSWPLHKAASDRQMPVMFEIMDREFIKETTEFLERTMKSPDALLVRWKLRRLLESLAKERSKS